MDAFYPTCFPLWSERAEAIRSRLLQRGGVGGVPVRAGGQRSEAGSGRTRQEIFGRRANFIIVDDPYARLD